MNTVFAVLLVFFSFPSLMAKALKPAHKRLWLELEKIEKEHQEVEIHLPEQAKTLIKSKDTLKNYKDNEILDLEQLYLKDELKKQKAARGRLRKRSR